ncbi:mucin-binding protein [Lactovum odontotermitis]
MSYQHQKKKISDKGNTHYRTWKKGKSWCYSFSILAALAGGVVLASQTVNADLAVSVTTTEAADTFAEATEASASPSDGGSASTTTENSVTAKEAVESMTSREISTDDEITAEPEIVSAIPLAATEKEAAPISAFSVSTTLAKAPIQDLQVTFTDSTNTQTLTDGDTVPLFPSGKGYGVGAILSFSLDTTGYAAGDTVTISRSELLNGTTAGLSAIAPFDVKDPASGETLGTISAAAGDILFTLAPAAITAKSIDISSLKIPTVFLMLQSSTVQNNYKLTIGDQATINLVLSPGKFASQIDRTTDVSADGSSQSVTSSTSTTVNWEIYNTYGGHVAQDGTPSDYTDATGGIIRNVSGNGNTIAGVGFDEANYGKLISFWSGGKLYTCGVGTTLADGTVVSVPISGINTNNLKDASSKLNANMRTAEEAEAVLEPGEWGSVQLPDGSWLWAYKTGNPSEGLTMNGQDLIDYLDAVGIPMTDEDRAKNLSQKEFIAFTTQYMHVTFSNSTINGTAINDMPSNSRQVVGSTLIPSSDSEVSGYITVSYIDDITGLPLDSDDTIKGKTGTVSDYSTADRIAEYEAAGYELVEGGDYYSNSAPVTFGGLSDKLVQPFEVHFVHGTKAAEPNTKTVNETIHYVNKDDGSQIAPDKTQTVTFTQTGTIDLVKEKAGDSDATTWDEWAPASNSFAAVDSPEIENYTADQESIPEVTDLTSNSEDQEFTVYYTAKTEAVTETKDVTETIHYVYEDGTEAAADHTDTVTFSRPATKNLATGVVTPDGDGHWTAENDDTRFDAVTSPAIDGYTADKLSVEEVTGLTAASENTEETVTYTKNSEAPVPDDDTKDTPAPEPTDTTPTPKTTINLQPVSQPAKKAVLPSTGDEERSIAVAAGGLVILGAGLLGVIRHLRRKKQ